MRKANSTFSSNVLSWFAALVVIFASAANTNAQCTLICNDLVNISLAEDCSLTLLPDMILEGGGCPNGQLVVEVDRTLPYGNGPWVAGILNAGDLNRTFAVRVRNAATPNGNTCWGMLHVEDKLAPEIECSDITISCAITDYDPLDLLALDFSQTEAYPFVDDNCYTPSLTFTDQFFDQACGSIGDLSAYVIRTWRAVDGSGNSSTCQQFIYFERRHAIDVDFPADITIQCDESYPKDAQGRPAPSYTGVPSIQDFGLVFPIFPNNTFCELNATYSDQLINVCEGTRKYLRTWTVFDWCLPTGPGNPRTRIQLIKIVDEFGPEIACPSDMTVSTNPAQCCATVNLPDVIITDNCSSISRISAMITVYDQYLPGQVVATYTLNNVTNPGQFTLTTFLGNNFWNRDTLGRYGNTPCLPIGTHLVTYMAEDVCGNISSCTFDLTVVDDVPPVATCTQFTTVAIGTDDPTDCYVPSGACKFAGVTWVPASAFNQGSYDNCNGIAFTVRRMPGYSDCIEDLKNNAGCDNWSVDICGELNYNQDNGLNDEYDIATAENDSIKFYCCEVGTTQMIILRVYQLDINGDWAYFTDEFGEPMRDFETNCIMYIYNECMIEVEVQDKIKPECVPPAHVTVSCQNFDPSLWAYGYPSVSDNCCLDETPPTSAAPGGVANIPAGTTAVPGVCGATQKTYYSGFLNAAFDTTCNRGIIIRRFTAWDCYGFSSSCTQRITVTNVPDYNIEFPADKTVNCVTEPVFGAPIITNDEGCELIGIAYNDVYFTVVPDACYKIERTWTVINWCDYNPDLPCYDHPRDRGRFVRVWDNPAVANGPWPLDPPDNCVTYKQIIKVIDQTPPTITCAPIDTCDYSTNDARFWNDGDLWWDNGIMSHDLCETDKTLLSVSAADLCDSISPVGGLRFRYLLFLDLDGDGIMETVVSSADANTTRPNGLYGRVRYNNYQNLNYGGGNIRRFDLSGNPFAFNIEQTATGARVTWRTAGGTVQNPNLPHGRHKIKWIAEDGCGNEAVCERFFTIRDCKAPVVACADVNINLMFGGMATLWANDFFLYGEDNCTPVDILESKVAVIRQDQSDGVTYPAGSPQSIIVTCADQGTNVAVEVWLIDAAGNADYCIAYVNVQANLVGCNTPATATVAGALTSNAQGVEQANVELNGTPNVNMTFPTSDNGAFNFANVPMGANITVTPTKDDNPLNGVTTYDLVLVSKHILGLEPLNTPYKMIAADANRSGSITTFDIVEFRKLILGIYNELPNNTSWRFVDKSYTFPNPSNPFQSAIPENVSIGSLSADMMINNFEGVKIGDVNGTAIANSLQSVEDRTAATMLFDVQDRTVKAGEVFTVNFKGAERVQGYQFTMNFNSLEVQDITPGENMKLDNFGVFADAITTSVDGEANEFAVTFRATKAGQISNMLGISSRITKAEGYSLTNDRLDVAFRFRSPAGMTTVGVGFELYQNQPNPFVNKTFIGFHLPEAANATLRIFDETGRMVFTQNGEFAKGYNTISVDRALLNTTGLLYYTLETATDSATKKMIQSK